MTDFYPGRFPNVQWHDESEQNRSEQMMALTETSYEPLELIESREAKLQPL